MDDQLGLLFGDHGFMGVFIDDPLIARFTLCAAFIAAIGEGFIVHVPYGVASIGEGVPFNTDQAGVRDVGHAGSFCRPGSCHAVGAQL
ncbi:hypothetical protein Q9292_10060 [Methylophilus sp. VKM B-3414]|uniref:hypothetical protein n=1 Tax=Methylophilus sp. VKM B-3414 TaxID=3076121 RepID=UPI0028C9B6C0|nr:hypothetical protein [Methylophilus sp. VKM B-3414]MDT7849955.1 hypothetical protein [Methylophilus sp. VKM B-3414]